MATSGSLNYNDNILTNVYTFLHFKHYVVTGGVYANRNATFDDAVSKIIAREKCLSTNNCFISQMTKV